MNRERMDGVLKNIPNIQNPPEQSKLQVPNILQNDQKSKAKVQNISPVTAGLKVTNFVEF